ncbi:hypothetical protein V1478_008106 [Vespula squamosa]|uniref:Uncharacterized protein n=1 Tax=Vespula squamosa TaxID=30214 RepID=A0ABD2AXT7_VESSQ
MMKYVIVACLCLMLVLGQAKSQDQQETTTDKRVERDVDMNQMPGQGSGFPAQIGDMVKMPQRVMDAVLEGTRNFPGMAKDGMSNFGSRRRRSSEKQ